MGVVWTDRHGQSDICTKRADMWEAHCKLPTNWIEHECQRDYSITLYRDIMYFNNDGIARLKGLND